MLSHLDKFSMKPKPWTFSGNFSLVIQAARTFAVSFTVKGCRTVQEKEWEESRAASTCHYSNCTWQLWTKEERQESKGEKAVGPDQQERLPGKSNLSFSFDQEIFHFGHIKNKLKNTATLYSEDCHKWKLSTSNNHLVMFN